MHATTRRRLCLLPLIALVACGDPAGEPMDAGSVTDTSFPDTVVPDGASRPDVVDSGPGADAERDVDAGLGALTPPANFAVTDVAETSAVAGWEDRSGAEELFVIESWSDELGFWSEFAPSPADSTSLMLEDLMPDTDYGLRVRARNSSGTSEPSNEQWFRTGTSVVSECGNNRCEQGESPASCPADCEPVVGGGYPVGGWTIVANFDEGTVGTEAQGRNMLSDAFSDTLVTTEESRAGGQAARVHIDEGVTGFGQWGGLLRFASALGEGEEVWYRVYVYFPSDFSFDTDSGMMKFMRVHTTRSPDDHNGGYHGVNIRRGGGGVAIGSEVSNEHFANHTDWRSRGGRVALGEWHAFEMHLRYSANPADAEYQVWQDGELVFQDGGQTATLKSRRSTADFVYIFSYFNGGSPQDQHAYIDEIVITSGMPQDRDANGNPFIGLGIIAPR